jgi:hypothetical protein
MEIGEFIERHGVRVRCEKVVQNPRLLLLTPEDHALAAGGGHWKVSVRSKGRGGASRTFQIMMTKRGGEPAPTAEEVLDTLALDAAFGEETVPIAELAADIGSSEEMTTKYRDICVKRASGLRKLFGQTGASELIHDVSRRR